MTFNNYIREEMTALPFISLVFLTLSMLLSTSNIYAETSTNIGYESEYIFRGIAQEKSSASAGLDFSSEGFYIGTWAAQVTDGLEVDGFFGYNGSNESGDFTYNLGFTGYYYTDDFDDTYQEINLGFCYGSFCLDSAFGDYENFDGPTLDYSFFNASYSFENGVYVSFGDFSKDAEGSYLELGYGFSLGEMEGTIKYISSNSTLVSPSGDNFLVFGISKSFDL